MSLTQYQTLMQFVRRIDERTERIEQRLAWAYPTAPEMREQIDASIDAILGCAVRVFEDD